MPAAYLALLFSGSAFVICIFSFFYFKAYLKRRTGQERILSELREEVDNIVRLIDETTERDISLIEEREKRLKSLLEEIEKRMKVYIRELEKRRDAENISTQAASVPPAKSEGTYNELGKNRYRSSGQELPQPAESTPEAPAAAPSPEGNRVPELPRSDAPAFASIRQQAPVGERVRELARAGFAPTVIASRLGLSIAEVEFAVALLERRDAQ